MSTHTSWSQMEQGELISYETNLAACYEAEYLLSLQYKTNCQCTDPHSRRPSTHTETIAHTETMDYNSCQNIIENNTELRNSTNDVVDVVENFSSSRKRPHHDASDVNHIHNCKTTVNVTEQPMNGCSGRYGCNANIYCYRGHDNNNYLVDTSPHVKRMCVEAQQCQS